MNIAGIIIRLAIFMAILFIIDLYAFQAIKTAFRQAVSARWSYWIFSGLVYAALIYLMIIFDRNQGPQNNQFQFIMALTILSLVPKLILLISMLGEDVFRLGEGIVTRIGGKETEFMPDRRRFVSQTAVFLAAIPFVGIIHGVFKGKYNYRVIRKTLVFDDLPEAFDGFQVTQISDVHSGSLTILIRSNMVLTLSMNRSPIFFYLPAIW